VSGARVVEQKTVEVMKFVAARLRKYVPSRHRDDIAQEAAVHALEAGLRYCQKTAATRNPFAFMSMAAFRGTRLWSRRASKLVTFSERAYNEDAVQPEVRIDVDGGHGGRINSVSDRDRTFQIDRTLFRAGYSAPAADDRVRHAEIWRERHAARIRWRRRMDHVIRDLGPEEHRAAEMLLGLDEEPSEPREVVWRTGMSWPAVTKLVAKLAARASGVTSPDDE
jgi:hypothetical protein